MNNIIEMLRGVKVEWKKLGEVADYQQPGKYLVTSNEYKDDNPTPVLTAGKTFILGYTDEQEGIYRAGTSPVIIFDDFTTDNKWVDFDFKIKSSAIKLITSKDEEVVLLKFIYYWLNTLPSEVKEQGLKRQWISNYTQILIPIPPLAIQEKIVEILDKFTELEAELEAELYMRKQQYKYYRNKLLNFNNIEGGGNIVWKKLGEVCEVVTDFTAAGSFASNAKNVKYRRQQDYAQLIRTTDLKSNFTNADSWIFIDENAFNYLWRVNINSSSIVLPNVGNCGEVYYVDPNNLPSKNNVLGPNAILLRSNSCINKFLFYLFECKYFQDELRKITTTIGQTKFNKTELKNILIPIPPLAEQQRIVSILDQFDTLTTSISAGLPREIELRHKQYEYYRNLLLSF